MHMEGWYTADVTLPYIDGNRPSITVPAKNRGKGVSVTFSDIFHVTRLYQCNPHVSYT